MASLPSFPGFPSTPPSPPSPPSPPPSGGTSGIPAVPYLNTPPAAATDSNNAANSVVEGAAVNTLAGITAHSADAEGQTVTYSLGADSSGSGFKIDPATGVVSVADPSKIDFESAPGHAYTITVNSSDGYSSSSQNFTIAVADVAPTMPVDSNAAANAVTEGAPANTPVGITASSTDVNGPAVTYSLTGDTSGGGFKIDPSTGIVTVADGTKIDYESAPGHAYTVTVQTSDGTLTSSQTFTIAVNDVPLSTPVDANAAANSVVEGAANGTAVGITAAAVDPNGPVTSYSLTGDSSLGGFTINAATGIVTVADASKIDYESSGGGHSYTITVQAQAGAQTTSQIFTVGVTDVAPSAPTDSNAAANTVAEGAANGSTVGITASSTDVNGPAVTYSLTSDSSGGGFTINATTGVVTVADSTKIDYESAPGHAYTVTAQASDGTLTSSQTFSIAVSDVAPSTPVDSNAAANSVAEGAANGSTVGITASSTDVNGPGVTYSLVGDTSGGGFTINATTGVVTVADATKIDYESAPGHAYTITAQASDGTLSSSQTFTIGVSDAAPSTPVDSNAGTNAVTEGAANGSTVGITASSNDVNGPGVTWALVGDTSGGGFTINATTGVVTVADSTKIDFESSGGSYTVVAQASDGTLTSAQAFVIAVTDVAPSTPVDSNAAANTVVEGAANGSTVGVTASSTDVNGPAVTYSLTGDTSGGGFTINAATGVVTVADSTKIDFESSGGSYTVTAQASDGTLSSSQTFTIAVADVAPSTPVDSDAAANTVAEGAANGSTVGVTVSSTDVNGPAVTYSLTGDTSGGGFTINAATGVVTVADSTKIDYESAPGHAYTVTAQASDGTLSSSQVFTIAVQDAAPSTPVDSDAGANTISESAANGSHVGITTSSTDVNGPAVTYSLVGDTSGGGFTINATTGVVTVADSTKIDFESSGGSYTVVAQSSDGTLTSSQAFVIAVTDVAPSTPVDSNATTNQVIVGSAAGSTVGVTASSTDVNGPAVTYSLVGDTSGGGFTINAATGVVTVADSSKIHSADPSYDITVDSSDGTLHSQRTFTIGVTTDTPPVANDDSVSATEAGGLNNAIAGSNPSGNVILGTGSAGNVQDTDAEDASAALTVVAVHTGPEGGSIASGTVNSSLTGNHGALTLHTDGSYTYAVNQTDGAVEALRTSTQTLTDTFNYTIQDTGGLQDTATLTVTIHGANDAPIAAADNPIAVEAGGLNNGTAGTDPGGNVLTNDIDPDSAINGETKTVQGVATGTQAGPLTLNVGTGVVTANGYGTLTIAADGTYSYVVNNANAAVQALRTSAQTLTDTFSYTMHDASGATSTTQVTVTIEGANDNPTANADTANATEAAGTNNSTAGTNISGFNVLTGVGAGSVADTDPDTAANGESQAVTGVETGSHPGDTVTTGTGAPLVGQYGTLTLNTDGSYNYNVDNSNATVDALNAGNHVDDVFTYTMQDAAGAKSTTTLTIHVNGADEAPVAVDQGSAASPAYTALDAIALNVSASGVKAGATDVDDTFASLSAAKVTNPAHGTATVNSDGSFTYTAASGYFGNDSFTYHVTDGGGLSSNTATAFISVTPHVAYIDNTASATGEDGSLAHPFASIADFNTANTAANHFDIIYVEKGTGTYSTTNGITLRAGQVLESQAVDASYVRGDNGQTVVLHDFDNSVGAATISVSSGTAVTLSTGNTIQGINITESGSGAGIVDNGSSVGTFNMSGVNITTGAGAGLSLTHGGTVNATTIVGTNSITSTTGTALNITSTNIGSGNVTFHDISANGGVNGIVLNNTGTSGHLAVTGTGTTAGSGGTIQNTSGDGISLTSTQGVSLSNMNITGAGGDGINGNTLNGLVLSGLSVSGNGNSTAGNGEGNIYLSELTGDASHVTTFNNLSVANAYVHDVFIENTAGTLTDLQVSNSSFTNNGASTHAGDAFEINLASGGLAGSPTATVHATNNTFSGNLSSPSTFTATGFAGSADDGTLNVHIGDGTAGGLNTFDTNNSGITINATNTGNINFDINDNTVNHNRAVGITANNQGSGVLTGFVRNNVVGQQGVAGSGSLIGNGIDIDDEGSGAAHVTTIAITNNIVQSVGDGNGSGFDGITAVKGNGSNSTGTFNLTVTGNTIRDILDDAGLTVLSQDTAHSATMNIDVHGNTFSNADGGTSNPKYSMRIGGGPGANDTVNVPQGSAAALAAANGLVSGNGVGQGRVDNNVVFGQAAPPSPPSTPQLALNGEGPGSADTLTMDQLAPLLLAAVQHWADAGASAAQIALLDNTHVNISGIASAGVLANTDANGITIDANGAGWGWFIDSTPNNNSEFSATSIPNDLKATSGDAASHIDLLTVLEHEMGHVLGLEDSNQPGIMNVNLDTGERREPDAADVTLANSTLSSFQTIEPTLPPQPNPASTTSSSAVAAGQTYDAGHGGQTLVGTAGPDNFVFADVAVHAPTAPLVTLIENYSFAQGDKFDFSAITSQFHGSAIGDALIVRAVEDASGKFATLQVDTFDPHGLPGPANWVGVAQIDGAHAGDAVNVLIDGQAVHLAQIHVGLLA